METASFESIVHQLVGIDSISCLPVGIHVPRHLNIQLTLEEGELLKAMFLRAQAAGIQVYDPWSHRRRPLINHSDIVRIVIRSLRQLAEEQGYFGANGSVAKQQEAKPKQRAKREQREE